MIGSFAMILSSLFVVTNALKLRYFKSKKRTREVLTMTKTMKITGMMCPHCTGRTQNALNAIDGVNAVVDLTDGGTAFITLEKEVSDEILIKTVTDAGYTVTSIE
jgi:Cu+-exporting ATPase